MVSLRGIRTLFKELFIFTDMLVTQDDMCFASTTLTVEGVSGSTRLVPTRLRNRRRIKAGKA